MNHMPVCNGYTPYWDTTEDNDMAKRVNVMLDDALWRVIERLPCGSRRRAGNATIRGCGRVLP